MKKKAFTLIELLVVIAIIALLMGILMPALRKVRDLAKRIHCVANVRTLSMGWLLYKDDHDDKLVRGHNAPDWQPDDWAHAAQSVDTIEEKMEAIEGGALFPYVGKTVEVYRCPSDERIKDPGQFTYRSFSIANGANGEDWPGTHVPARKYSEILNPARKYIFLEDIDPRGDNVGSWQMQFSSSDGPSFIDPVAMWHDKRTTVGFADGSSEMHEWQDQTFIEWCEGCMYRPATFSFNMTPPADEQEDLRFLAEGFPCKSHD